MENINQINTVKYLKLLHQNYNYNPITINICNLIKREKENVLN
jgi:hypothetical protein